jgi:hypothetical protein
MTAGQRRVASIVEDAARGARWLRVARNVLLVLAVIGHATSVACAEPRADHGSSDVYTAPGIGIVWGIERGAGDAEAVVVIRIATDPATYPWLTVRGVNPFTNAETPLLQPTAVERSVDVRIPRARFADHPRTEVRLYATQDAARSGTASVTVFYLGVPDTTPEFADRAKLEASLTERMARARAAKGPQ